MASERSNIDKPFGFYAVNTHCVDCHANYASALFAADGRVYLILYACVAQESWLYDPCYCSNIDFDAFSTAGSILQR